MRLALVVAMSRNGVIGKDGDLPWHLRADLNRFKELTTGHIIIMGRATHESILRRLGKPLPNRTSIVLSRDSSFDPDGVIVAWSWSDGLEKAGELAKDKQEVFVIGGASVYEQALPIVTRKYVTLVDAELEGDTFFPPDPGNWREEWIQSNPADEHNQYPYTFVVYVRIKE